MPGAPLFPNRLRAIVSVSAGSVLYTLDGGIAAVALPSIAKALGITGSDVILLIFGYNIVLAMALLPLAAIGDRVGHRKIFRTGLVVYLVSALTCLFVDNFWMLFAARCSQALAAASVLSVSLAIVRSIYPVDKLGRGMGINTMAASLGAGLAPMLGGAIVTYLDWSLVFAAGAPLALLALALSGTLPVAKTGQAAFDRYGAFLCAACIGLTLSGFQGLGGRMPSTAAIALILAGITLTFFFVRLERKISFPVLPVDLLTDRRLSLCVAAALSAVLSSTMLLIYIPFHLSAAGISAGQIGAMLTPYALAIMIAAPASGMLSDRISPTTLALIGLAIASVGCGALGFVDGVPTLGEMGWRMAVCGVGFGVFFSPNGRMVIGSVPRERAAGAGALLATTRMLGQAIGATATGLFMASVFLRPLLPFVPAALVLLSLVFTLALLPAVTRGRAASAQANDGWSG